MTRRNLVADLSCLALDLAEFNDTLFRVSWAILDLHAEIELALDDNPYPVPPSDNADAKA